MRKSKHSAGRATPEQLLAMWQRWQDSGDQADRNRLVMAFAPMVRFIVYRKMKELPASCEVEDFVSSGFEALIRSLERFDPAKGASIEQFAWTRIQGAVLDELRRADWAPRSLRKTEREIGRASTRFLSEHHRNPTDEELSGELGISEAELARAHDDLHRAQVASLNGTVTTEEDGASATWIDTLVSDDRDADPTHRALRSEAHQRLQEALIQLPERDRQIALMLYVDNLTLREIGERLGVSESRVCQIRSAVLGQLRQILDPEEELFAAVIG